MSWEADTLKKLRIERKLTQAQFAEWLEIPLITYNQWERGIRNPPLYVIKLIQYKCNSATNGEQLIIPMTCQEKFKVLFIKFEGGSNLEFYNIYTLNDPKFDADVRFRESEDKKGYRFNPIWETFEVVRI